MSIIDGVHYDRRRHINNLAAAGTLGSQSYDRNADGSTWALANQDRVIDGNAARAKTLAVKRQTWTGSVGAANVTQANNEKNARGNHADAVEAAEGDWADGLTALNAGYRNDLLAADTAWRQGLNSAGETQQGLVSAAADTFDLGATDLAAGRDRAVALAINTYHERLYQEHVPTSSIDPEDENPPAALQSAEELQIAAAQADADRATADLATIDGFLDSIGQADHTQLLGEQAVANDLGLDLRDDAAALDEAGVNANNTWSGTVSGAIDSARAALTKAIAARISAQVWAAGAYEASLAAISAAYANAQAEHAVTWTNTVVDAFAELRKRTRSQSSYNDLKAAADATRAASDQTSNYTRVDDVGAAQVTRATSMGNSLVTFATTVGGINVGLTDAFNQAEIAFVDQTSDANIQYAGDSTAHSAASDSAATALDGEATADLHELTAGLDHEMGENAATGHASQASAMADHVTGYSNFRSDKSGATGGSSASDRQKTKHAQLSGQAAAAEASGEGFEQHAEAQSAAALEASDLLDEAAGQADAAESGAAQDFVDQTAPIVSQHATALAQHGAAYDNNATATENALYLDVTAANAAHILAVAQAQAAFLIAQATAQKTKQSDLVRGDADGNAAANYTQAIADAKLALATSSADADLDWQNSIALADKSYSLAAVEVLAGYLSADAASDASYLAGLADKQADYAAESISAEAEYLLDTERAGTQRELDEAEANALFDSAKYSGNLSGAQASSTALGDTPASEQKVATAQSLVDWHNGSGQVAPLGTGTGGGLKVSHAVEIKSAEDDYWQTATIAFSTKAAREATAAAQYQSGTATAEAILASDQTAADADYTVRIANGMYSYVHEMAVSSYNQRVTAAVAQRDYEIGGINSATRDEYVTAANETYTSNVAAASHQFNKVEALALGRWRIAQATADYDYTVRVTGDWNDLVAEDADAERDYLNTESAANKDRTEEEASADAEEATELASGKSSAVSANVAGADSSHAPFAQHAADEASASSNKVSDEAEAREVQIDDQAEATADAEETAANAEEEATTESAESEGQAAVDRAKARLDEVKKRAYADMQKALRNERTTTLPTIASNPRTFQPLPGEASITGFTADAADSWYSGATVGWLGSHTPESIANSIALIGLGAISGNNLMISNTGTHSRGFGATTSYEVNADLVDYPTHANHLHGSPGDGQQLSGDNLRDKLKRSYKSATTPPRPNYGDGHPGASNPPASINLPSTAPSVDNQGTILATRRDFTVGTGGSLGKMGFFAQTGGEQDDRFGNATFADTEDEGTATQEAPAGATAPSASSDLPDLPEQFEAQAEMDQAYDSVRGWATNMMANSPSDAWLGNVTSLIEQLEEGGKALPELLKRQLLAWVAQAAADKYFAEFPPGTIIEGEDGRLYLVAEAVIEMDLTDKPDWNDLPDTLQLQPATIVVTVPALLELREISKTAVPEPSENSNDDWWNTEPTLSAAELRSRERTRSPKPQWKVEQEHEIKRLRKLRSDALAKGDEDGERLALQAVYRLEGRPVWADDAYTIPRKRAAAKMVAEMGAGFIPVVGEAMDVIVIIDPRKPGYSKVFAVVSLGLSFASATLLPNWGSFRRGLKGIHGAKSAERVLEAGLDSGALRRIADDIGGTALRGGGAIFDAAGQLQRNGRRPRQAQAAINTCGPTCIGMTLDTINPGRASTEIINLQLTARGTTIDKLATLLNKNGVNATWRRGLGIDDVGKATAKGNPLIAHVNVPGGGGHFVVVDGITTRMGQLVVAIRDPIGGRQYFELVSEFSKRFSGHVVARPW